MASLFDEIKKSYDQNEIEKFNPHHDAMGRFSTGPNAVSFTRYTRDPKKQHWAERARDRESVRVGVLGSDQRMVDTKLKRSKKTGNNVHKPTGQKIGNAEQQRRKMKRADERGEKFESARERKNRLARENRAKKKKNPPQPVKNNNQNGSKVRQMPGGNKRPKKSA